MNIWDRGSALHPIDRALTILAVACPEQTYGELASFTIGQRDALLWNLRMITFGEGMDCVTGCPACGQQLEFTVRIDELLGAVVDGTDCALSFSEGTYEVDFRLPNSYDLAQASGCGDAADAGTALFRRCVVRSRKKGRKVPPAKLPQRVREIMAERVARCEPISDVDIELQCAECDHRWSAPLDIVSFFWMEISEHVKTLLRQVHILAGAYGWQESEIVAMSPARRRFYIEMVT